MAFDNSGTKAVLSASRGPTPKRCELPLFLAALRQAVRGWKVLDLGSLNMQFQQEWPKDKKITALFIFIFFFLSVSPLQLYHLSMRILVMSIDSNFVFEFIARVMVILLVHSMSQVNSRTRVASAMCRT